MASRCRRQLHEAGTEGERSQHHTPLRGLADGCVRTPVPEAPQLPRPGHPYTPPSRRSPVGRAVGSRTVSDGTASHSQKTGRLPDTHSTAVRRAQLDAACDEKETPRRDDNDPVLVIVPRRNIETWLAFLGGTTVDEDTKYRKLKREGDCVAQADALFRMCHEVQRLDEGAPPSLREACEEYPKLRR